MERYRYDPGVLTVSVFRFGAGKDSGEEPELDEVEDIDGYKVFDAHAGHIDGAWVAFSRDGDTAERLVRLLNEDERLKAHQAFLRGAAQTPREAYE